MPGGDQELTAVDRLKLGLSRSYYALARALRLNELHDALAGSSIAPNAAVWLLGRHHSFPGANTEAEEEEALAFLLHCFQSIPWMSYRTGFTAISAGSVQLHSDAGWGCTLRSGQMILAQGLVRHLLGPDWRWPGAAHQPRQAQAPSGGEAPPQLAWLLQLFWDTPADCSPFSIHGLCRAGHRCGVVPGRWLGPWVMCKTLEAAAAAVQQQVPELGLTVAVLGDSGGGAPLLVTPRFAAALGGGDTDGGGARPQLNGSPAAAPAPTAELVAMDSTTLAVEVPTLQAGFAQAFGDGGGSGARRGLLLLVPLVLGLGKVNPRYLPQLEAVLSMPQSVGIVGGRPSSSLYFVGYQQQAPGAAAATHNQAAAQRQAAAAAPAAAAEQHAAAAADGGVGGGGSSVIYLDPHQVQEAACSAADWRTYRCEAPRAMPLPSIDPSLALGFYCGSPEAYRDLCERLAALERQAGGAPLVCVTSQAAAAARCPSFHETGAPADWEPDELCSSDGELDADEALAAAAAQEEPLLLQPDVIAEAAAAMPLPPAPPAAAPGSAATAEAAAVEAAAACGGGGQQQGVGLLASPRQMSRGWELL